MIDISNKKKVHFIGIGGIGMSAIAEILHSQGHRVTGSDMNRSEIVENLEKKGITVFHGHRKENIDSTIDIIVYTAAIGNENVEYIEGKRLGITMMSRAGMLGELMKHSKNSIAVAGTHGKTTTTSMLSIMLQKANLDPTLLVGGALAEINGNVRIGGNEYFLTEACEYMDSFLLLRPNVEIILNIDSDHLDYFRDIEHISESFEKFAGLVPDDGKIIAYSANPFVNKAVSNMKNVVTFGLNEDCDYWAANIDFDSNGVPSYDLYKRSDFLGRINMSMPGEYNILNSLAAVACADTLGISMEIARETLKDYTGTQRRFDFLGNMENGARVIDDYAHHPTEIKAALKAAKNIDKKEIWCIFQPHTYTRTIALFDEFVDAFEDADNIIMAEIYAAREKNIHKISSKSLADKIGEKYPQKNIKFFSELSDIAKFIKENADSEDIVMTMGAGDIYKVGELIIK